MRASYQKDLKVLSEYIIRGDSFHHLANVVRLRVGEEILLLNGQGLEVRCQVDQVSKKEIFLKTLFHEEKTLPYRIDLALGMPKKDALDLSLKQAVELGVHTCYLVRSSHSQMKLPEADRLQKLLISALEQSNSPHLTEAVPADFDDIDYTFYDQVIVLDSQSKGDQRPLGKGKYLLIIGPEGGFSPSELEFFDNVPNLIRLNLPTPIMRTPTALSCGVGVILQRLMD